MPSGVRTVSAVLSAGVFRIVAYNKSLVLAADMRGFGLSSDESNRSFDDKDWGSHHGKNIFDESWIKGAQSSPIQGSEGADDHETHDYH